MPASTRARRQASSLGGHAEDSLSASRTALSPIPNPAPNRNLRSSRTSFDKTSALLSQQSLEKPSASKRPASPTNATDLGSRKKSRILTASVPASAVHPSRPAAVAAAATSPLQFTMKWTISYRNFAWLYRSTSDHSDQDEEEEEDEDEEDEEEEEDEDEGDGEHEEDIGDEEEVEESVDDETEYSEGDDADADTKGLFGGLCKIEHGCDVTRLDLYRQNFGAWCDGCLSLFPTNEIESIWWRAHHKGASQIDRDFTASSIHHIEKQGAFDSIKECLDYFNSKGEGSFKVEIRAVMRKKKALLETVVQPEAPVRNDMWSEDDFWTQEDLKSLREIEASIRRHWTCPLEECPNYGNSCWWGINTVDGHCRIHRVEMKEWVLAIHLGSPSIAFNEPGGRFAYEMLQRQEENRENSGSRYHTTINNIFVNIGGRFVRVDQPSEHDSRTKIHNVSVNVNGDSVTIDDSSLRETRG